MEEEEEEAYHEVEGVEEEVAVVKAVAFLVCVVEAESAFVAEGSLVLPEGYEHPAKAIVVFVTAVPA